MVQDVLEVVGMWCKTDVVLCSYSMMSFLQSADGTMYFDVGGCHGDEYIG